MGRTIERNVRDQWMALDEEIRKRLTVGMRKGMNKASIRLKNRTKKNLKSSLPRAGKQGKKFNDKLIDGVRVNKYRELPGFGSLSGVHIMGIREKGSGTYRLRFFEGGTDERGIGLHFRKYKRKGGTYPVKAHDTGKIKGLWFFKKSIDQEIKNAPSIIEEQIFKALQYAGNKK